MKSIVAGAKPEAGQPKTPSPRPARPHSTFCQKITTVGRLWGVQAPKQGCVNSPTPRLLRRRPSSPPPCMVYETRGARVSGLEGREGRWLHQGRPGRPNTTDVAQRPSWLFKRHPPPRRVPGGRLKGGSRPLTCGMGTRVCRRSPVTARTVAALERSPGGARSRFSSELQAWGTEGKDDRQDLAHSRRDFRGRGSQKGGVERKADPHPRGGRTPRQETASSRGMVRPRWPRSCPNPPMPVSASRLLSLLPCVREVLLEAPGPAPQSPVCSLPPSRTAQRPGRVTPHP